MLRHTKVSGHWLNIVVGQSLANMLVCRQMYIYIIYIYLFIYIHVLFLFIYINIQFRIYINMHNVDMIYHTYLQIYTVHHHLEGYHLPIGVPQLSATSTVRNHIHFDSGAIASW